MNTETATEETTIRYGQPYPLYQQIAGAIIARDNCIKSNNPEWKTRHEDSLNQLAEFLPSGSDVDNGSAIDWERSTADKLVIHAGFHHMDPYGSYDGWTEHTITVRASLYFTLDIQVSGRNRNDIKEYLHELYDYALTRVYRARFDDATGEKTFEEVR